MFFVVSRRLLIINEKNVRVGVPYCNGKLFGADRLRHAAFWASLFDVTHTNGQAGAELINLQLKSVGANNNAQKTFFE